MDFKNISQMETFSIEVNMKTAKNTDFKKVSISTEMGTLNRELTGKPIFNMDFQNISILMETFHGELTMKTVECMDLKNPSMKTEKQEKNLNM